MGAFWYTLGVRGCRDVAEVVTDDICPLENLFFVDCPVVSVGSSQKEWDAFGWEDVRATTSWD